jgi:hypothetical protein
MPSSHVTTAKKDQHGLVAVNVFRNERWIAERLDQSRAIAVADDQFQRAVASELRLLKNLISRTLQRPSPDWHRV